MTTPLLEVRGADVRLGGAEILTDADLEVHAGQLVAIVGPNGAGKSTLGRAAAGLQPLAAGSVRLAGRDLASMGARERARERAFLPQRPAVPDGIRVREAVELGRAPHVGVLARPTAADAAAVEAALERTATASLAHRRLTTLSGGELQRVQLAVALAQEAPLLIADEPTAHLDLGAATAVARVLRGLADDGYGVALVVHDLALAAALADEVVVVHQGRTVARGVAAEILERELLAQVWDVDAELDVAPGGGRTALHVAWLGREVRA